MAQYRFRWIFLLLLMGHVTACSTSWQSPGSTASPEGEPITDVFVKDYVEESQVADYIEESQPEFIRGTARVGYEGRGRRQFEMDFPFVEGDKVVSVDSISVPIADIVFFTDNLSVPITDVSVADYIEESQPELIRVRTRGRRQFEMDFPFVEGNKVVSVDSISVPISDILQLMVIRFPNGSTAAEGEPKTDVSVADYIESEQPMEGEPKTDVSYADYIESEQPNQVRITLEDGSQMVLNAPYVQDDTIVSSDDQQSVPIAQITEMEGRGLDAVKSLRNTFYIVVGIPALIAAGLYVGFFGM